MAVLWLARTPKLVPTPTRDVLSTTGETIFVSVMSSWEYRHKRLRRPQELPVPFDELTAVMPVELLGLDYEVSRYADSLPLIHRDPFDRMLIAQAMHHGLTLITADKAMRAYPVPTLW